jgi:hypothetical protein
MEEKVEKSREGRRVNNRLKTGQLVSSKILIGSRRVAERGVNSKRGEARGTTEVDQGRGGSQQTGSGSQEQSRLLRGLRKSPEVCSQPDQENDWEVDSCRLPEGEGRRKCMSCQRSRNTRPQDG